MPIGVIVNSIVIFAGGLLGGAVGNKLSEGIKEKLIMIFGLCSMAMGITTVILMKNMPAVILAILVGTVIGSMIHFNRIIEKGATKLEQIITKIIPMKQENLTAEEETVRKNGLVTVILLFCASGTGIYGSIISGMNGDNSILFSKSILDFFSVIIFTCAYGAIVKYISIPQFIIFIIIFYLAKVIFPLTTPDMLNDFRAVSGILMIANGFRIMNLKMFPVADMIPAMILVFPLSALWSMIQF